MPDTQNSQDQLALPKAQLEKVNQSQRERLFYLDFTLYFLGSVNPTDQVLWFGIAEVAASTDFSLYKDLVSKKLKCNIQDQAYIRCDGFTPLFKYSGSHTLVVRLHNSGDNFVGTQKIIVTSEAATQPNYSNISSIAFITRIIHNSPIVMIEYQSLFSGLLKLNVRTPFTDYILRKLNIDYSKVHGLKRSEYSLYLKNTPILDEIDNMSFGADH